MKTNLPVPVVSIQLRFIFFFSSIWLLLTWTGIVIFIRILEVNDPEGTRGSSMPIPFISDASRHPSQHPFFAVSLSVALANIVYACAAQFLASIADVSQDSWKLAVSLGFSILSSLFLWLSACTFVETSLHMISAAIGVGKYSSFSVLYRDGISEDLTQSEHTVS